MDLKKIVEELTLKKRTIAAMESCTGGAFVNAITNVEGASRILKFSAVTYSNEYKIKMGVDQETIQKYTVYSMEVAKEMSKQISLFAGSDYGIGITGKLNRVDEDNPFGKDNLVFISIYDATCSVYHTMSIEVLKTSRENNKNYIIDCLSHQLLEVIK